MTCTVNQEVLKGWYVTSLGGCDFPCEHCGLVGERVYILWHEREILLPNVMDQHNRTHAWYLCGGCIDQLEQLTALAALAGHIDHRDRRA